MPTANLALEGKHNIKNAMAAATVAQLLKIRKQTIRECLENFHGVEHRLEHVLKINKVQYTRKQNKQKTQTKSKERMMLTNLIAAPQPVYPIEPLMQSPSSFAKF